MSNRPRLRPRRLPAASHDELIAAAQQAAEEDGCHCGPDVLIAPGPDGPQAVVGHDWWCPGITAPRRFAPVRDQSMIKGVNVTTETSSTVESMAASESMTSFLAKTRQRPGGARFRRSAVTGTPTPTAPEVPDDL